MSSIRLFAGMCVALALMGCVGSADEPTTDPVFTAAVDGEVPVFGIATLLEPQQARGVRSNVCVSFDAEGNVGALDEQSCSPAWDVHGCTDYYCPWVRCGECLMFFHAREDGTFFLSPQDNLGSCQTFAGAYEIRATAACR